jgi:hypothetical protein
MIAGIAVQVLWHRVHPAQSKRHPFRGRTTMPRSTVEVFDDHLARAERGDVEGDIANNFAPDCVLLTSHGPFEGHDGVRAAVTLLDEQVPEAKYLYTQRAVHEEIAFLEWTAVGRGAVIGDGADTFLIRNDRIRVMTIHYTVEPEDV